MRSATGLAVALLLNGEASAMNGNELNDWCRDDNIVAVAYVSGVVDAYHIAYAASKADSVRMCNPAGITLKQAKDVVCKYLVENPANRHIAAASIVGISFRKAWPCPP